MVFAIECIIACVLFTIALEILAARRRDVFVNDYPPIVTDRLRDLHMAADILMAPFDKFYKITCMTLTQQPQKTFLRLYPCPGRTRKILYPNICSPIYQEQPLPETLKLQ